MTGTLDMTDTATAVAVVGSDITATALTALDLARKAAPHRRVTIVDLLGDAPLLINKIAIDNPHGVSDCFAYGISFSAVTYPTDDPNITIIPSGTEPLDYAKILPSRRWEHFVHQSRDNDTLLVFAVPPEAAELGELLANTDRVVAAELVPRTPLAARTSGRRTPAYIRRRRLSRALAAVLLMAVVGGSLTYAWLREQHQWITHDLTRNPVAVTSMDNAQIEAAPGTPAAASETPPAQMPRDSTAPVMSATAAGAAAAAPDNPAAPGTAVAVAPQTVLASTPDTALGFDLQFVATTEAGVAHAQAEHLKQLGLDARVNKTGPDYHPLYRVLLGPYATRRSADSAGRIAHESFWVRGHVQ